MRPLALLVTLVLTGPLAADDKETIDPAKLVGKWKLTQPAVGFPDGATMVAEFTKTGEVSTTVFVRGAVFYQRDGKYTVSGSKLELVLRGPGAQVHKKTLIIAKLTDAVLHTKHREDDAGEHEWVTDEKKDK